MTILELSNIMEQDTEIFVKVIEDFRQSNRKWKRNHNPADKRIMWYIFCYNGNLG